MFVQLCCYFLALLPIAHSEKAQESLQTPPNFIERSVFAKQPARVRQLEYHENDEFTADIPYSGIVNFAHLNSTNCFVPTSDGVFDIGIVGAPFDLGVTYRPGARFGPAGTRMGSRRLAPSMGYR